MTEPEPSHDDRPTAEIVVITAGLAAIAAAATVSIVSMFDGEPESLPASDVSSVPVFAAFSVLAVAALGIAGVTFFRPDRTSRRTPIVLLTAVWFLVLVAAAANGLFSEASLFGADELFNPSRARTLSAFCLLIVGIPFVGVCLGRVDGAVRSAPRRNQGWMVLAVVAAVVGAGLAALPRGAAAEAVALTVTKLDVHPVSTTPVPTSISAQPQTVEIESNPEAAESRPGAPSRRNAEESRPVGPGFLLPSGELINADTGTVRWRIDQPVKELTMVADQRNGLVFVSDPARKTKGTAAIDADTGDIRWTSDLPVTAWVDSAAFGATAAFLDGGFPVSVSDDLRTVRAFAPEDGSVRWSHAVPRDCAVDQVRDRPQLTIATVCAGGEAGRIETVDQATGTVTSSRTSRGPADLALNPATAQLSDRFISASEPDNDRILSAIRDATTDRTVVDVGGNRSGRTDLESCTANSECIVRTSQTGRPDRIRIVSLTGSHPDIPIRGTEGDLGQVLWLRDQVLWVQGRYGESTPKGLVIVGRKTGATQVVQGVVGVPLLGPNGVTVAGEETLVHLEGSRS